MTRYEQWRANPSSIPPQVPASHPVPQPLVAHRSINSHGTNTPTSSSTPSSSRSHASISIRSSEPSPYEQSPTEDDRARRERVDALLREDPRRHEEVYPVDGAREDDPRRRREWEEEARIRICCASREGRTTDWSESRCNSPGNACLLLGAISFHLGDHSFGTLRADHRPPTDAP